ncbi:MAG: PilZ domain-containing protein [Sphingomonas sp.]|uniref:PilZ domain-containing protein n=1 Tax=Sphingomonas sp. TaxID=28214 RepID=UPI0017F9ABA2|nr:PilZ domain-containing protein [Sphingomonas sp.]MBA3666457.1 PilZ domain-containing protein [Sphingomonas sp.]
MSSQLVETTLYSLSEAPPRPLPSPERRDGERHMSLYRVGSIKVGDRRELCLIKNISAGGMLIHAYCALPDDIPLSIELKSGQPIHGRVSWIRDQSVGISFDEPIDLIDILSASMDGPRPRMPRIEAGGFVTLREGATSLRVKLCDISQGGVKLECATVLPIGAEVVVTLTDLPPQPGVLCWSADGHVGITFNRLLPLGELVAWLQAQREGMRTVS